MPVYEHPDWKTESNAPLPAGKYPAEIDRFALEESRSGLKFYKVVWRILEGRQKGRKVEDCFFVFSENSSKERDRLTFMLEINGANVSRFDTDRLLGKRSVVNVVLGKERVADDGNTYPPRNKIVSYMTVADWRATSESAKRGASASGDVETIPEDEMPKVELPDDGDLPF
jgi:hypothetical protein